MEAAMSAACEEVVSGRRDQHLFAAQANKGGWMLCRNHLCIRYTNGLLPDLEIDNLLSAGWKFDLLPIAGWGTKHAIGIGRDYSSFRW